MCGIAGILRGGGDSTVHSMVEALRHRGPDQQGVVTRPLAAIGATRLRIRDLTAGDQPIVSRRSGAVLVFNGEIYNYEDLRRRLETRSHRFETNTDSEVVLRAYEEYGPACVDHLRGMYAFAVLDGSRALLARDPLGIKPLHYAWLDQGRALAFASEIKSLLRCDEIAARIDERALGDLQVFDYIADPQATLLEGIFNLEPGCCLHVDLGVDGIRISRRFSLVTPEPFEIPSTLELAERRLDELLDSAIRSHLAADVPICLTLSGGLDSTLLGLLLRQQVGRDVVSYATGDDRQHADVVQAGRMAELLGFEHRLCSFDFNAYLAAVPATILAGESFTDSVPPYLLFRQISADFRVCLNGEGADELMGGYPEHWLADRYVARIRESSSSILLTERGAAEREFLRTNPRIDCDEWMYEHLLGSQLIDRHLHPLDKISMAASVEVRVPFLDYELVNYVRRLPTHWRIHRGLGSSKYLLRRAYLRKWRAIDGDIGLADAVLREKRGFPDARKASQSSLHRLCERTLPASYLENHPRRRFLRHAMQALWFDLFEYLFCEQRGHLPSGFDVIEFLAERSQRSKSVVLQTLASLAAGR